MTDQLMTMTKSVVEQLKEIAGSIDFDAGLRTDTISNAKRHTARKLRILAAEVERLEEENRALMDTIRAVAGAPLEPEGKDERI